ncbi:hypothetical protein [Gordonia aquimaris]|uniref:Uncharacterized protein n=1 Tax=Gordonia aquimaris TaxID=2984863 RepID=A0A9X3DAG2_9ACTN|nr:hypothetical protein [Gordonia aquimaris]MCX2966874.1 hypothetical protein [Gordonia aquimaris]
MDGAVSVVSVTRLEVEGAARGRDTGLRMHLVDGDGIASSAPVMRRVAFADCGCGDDSDSAEPPYWFTVFLPDVTDGTAIRLVDGDEVLWERQATDAPPRVSGLRAHTDESHLALDWTLEARSDDVKVWAQWACGDDDTWQGLSIGLRDDHATVPLTGLAAGPIRVRLLAHDGFYSTVSEPVSVDVPELPPTVVIIDPRADIYYPNGRILLNGTITDNAGVPLDGAELQWQIDGEPVGRGRQIRVEVPSPGRHEVTLAAHDDRVRDSVIIQVADGPA